MFVNQHRFAAKAARRGTAATLVLWLSGIALLFCCSPSMTAQAAERSCPLARAGSTHCQRSKTERPARYIDSGENCSDGCLLFPALFDKNRKVENTHFVAGIISSSAATFNVPLILKARQPHPKLQRSRVVDRSYTFIRNCTYRI